jgi:serine protease Do
VEPGHTIFNHIPFGGKQRMLAKRPYLSALVLLIFGVAFGATLVTGFGSWKGINLAFGASEPQLGGPLPKLSNDQTRERVNASFIEVSKAIQPTVVSISVKAERRAANRNDEDNPFRRFFNLPEGEGFDFGEPSPGGGLGSGVIITSDGYIMTNNHVIENAAAKGGIEVKLMDKRVFPGRLIGTDPTTDIAVIKIDATNLAVAAIGNSDHLQIGEWVIAVGNPLGLESTVTTGIVSSLGRSINIFDQQKTGRYGIANFIQTDAAINPGNSGGGLFDLSGAVIGINTAIASTTGTYAGYGFAVPMNIARAVAMDLIKTGKVNRGYIGVTIKGVDAMDAEALGLDRPRGVRVDDVVKGGAGEAAGLKMNDIILSIDGREVNESNELQGMIALRHAGDEVTLKIFRDGREIEKKVRLKPREDVDETADATKSSNPEEERQGESETATLEDVGLGIRNLSSQELDTYNVTAGVMITNVSPGSVAQDRGLVRNLVITKVGSQAVKNVTEFEKAIDAYRGRSVGLTVKTSKGDTHFFSLRIPRE